MKNYFLAWFDLPSASEAQGVQESENLVLELELYPVVTESYPKWSPAADLDTEGLTLVASE